MNTYVILFLALVCGVVALVFARKRTTWIYAQDSGTEKMQEIGAAVREGAMAFLYREYKVLAVFVVVVAGILAWINAGHVKLVALSFVVGAFCSTLSGFFGMRVATASNMRTTHAARTGLPQALQVAFSGGAVMGMCVVGLGVIGLTVLTMIYFKAFGTELEVLQNTVLPILAGFSMGASSIALFARVGGGIYTKAADVGADLVGKVEAGIPEDDPRNPAVVADLVGDNVGDCAGRGADLFESTAAENIGAMILGASLAAAADKAGMGFSMGVIGVMMFPLVARAFGIIASIVGIMMVKLDKEEKMDPMQALNRGYYVAVVLAMIGFGAATRWLLYSPAAPNAWLHFFAAGILGVLTSVAFVYITQYYTEYAYRPVKTIAEASTTGPATNIIAGIGVGLECVWMPALVMGVALLGSYYLGLSSGLPNAGLFGTAVATMGMLATAAYILAMDTFGPITDNAGGIVEMSQQPEEIRVKTDRLDSVGNTTKALTKGYAIGSAGLAAFLLFQAYMDEVLQYAGLEHGTVFRVDLGKPVVFVGALLGATLVFLFSSMAIRAVGKAAQSIIEEVRRQYAKLPRVNDMIQFPADFKPDYGSCVDIVTKSALVKMIAPGLLAVLTPIVVGLTFRVFITPEDKLIAAEAVAALLMVGTIVGIITALFLNNGGGAWDNAKKYIETGAHGGKYLTAKDGSKTKNPTHGAAVVGDTVGDPFKDTAGPSLHVLIKLLSTITLVLAPLFL